MIFLAMNFLTRDLLQLSSLELSVSRELLKTRLYVKRQSHTRGPETKQRV